MPSFTTSVNLGKLVCLDLSSLIYKMGIILLPTLEVFCQN